MGARNLFAYKELPHIVQQEWKQHIRAIELSFKIYDCKHLAILKKGAGPLLLNLLSYERPAGSPPHT